MPCLIIILLYSFDLVNFNPTKFGYLLVFQMNYFILNMDYFTFVRQHRRGLNPRQRYNIF